MPNVVKCRKYMTIQNISQILIILRVVKSGNDLHNSSELFP